MANRDRARFVADVYTVLHILIVCGIIAFAAAAEEVLLHPKDAAYAEFLLMLVAGLTMFYGGIAAAVFHVCSAIAKERLVALAAITALAYIGRAWSGVVILIAVDVVLLVTILTEPRRIERPSAASNPAWRENCMKPVARSSRHQRDGEPLRMTTIS